jgi:HdeA/HdeB family
MGTGNGRRWWIAVALLALPMAARADEAKAKPVDVKRISCKDFRALPDDIRPIVAAWVHGYSRQTSSNAWILDPARVKSFLTELDAACDSAPAANFSYKVLELTKARKAAAAPK